MVATQWECGRPLAQPQHPLPPPPPPIPQAAGSLPPAVLEAKVENFFSSRVEPQWGHGTPFQSLDRTSTSLSFSHFSQ
jgi:hypothetical protein